MWRNMVAADEHYGVVAVEPGRDSRSIIYLDGNTDDWFERTLEINTEEFTSPLNFFVSITHDPAYLYLLIQKPENTSWDFFTTDETEREKLHLGFDAVLSGGTTTVCMFFMSDAAQQTTPTNWRSPYRQ